MKLVQVLAKELAEWPEPVTHFSCDEDGEIRARGGNTIKPDFRPKETVDNSERGNVQSGVLVTREMWQAERERQKGGEWKRHRGNSQPVDEGTWVEVKLRCGDIQQGLANAFLWRHADCDVAANIMKFRVISKPQAEEVVPMSNPVKSFDPYGADHADHGPCHVQFIEAKTEQMETPFKWRDEVTELNAYIEKYTRERDALIEILASEGFALIPPVVSVMSEFEGVDMSDWRNWMAGDIVECVNQNGWADIRKGSQYVLNNSDFFSFVDDVGENRSFAFFEMEEGSVGCDFKFIRRP